jgi:hypothetical protein
MVRDGRQSLSSLRIDKQTDPKFCKKKKKKKTPDG